MRITREILRQLLQYGIRVNLPRALTKGLAGIGQHMLLDFRQRLGDLFGQLCLCGFFVEFRHCSGVVGIGRFYTGKWQCSYHRRAATPGEWGKASPLKGHFLPFKGGWGRIVRNFPKCRHVVVLGCLLDTGHLRAALYTTRLKPTDELQ